MRTGYPGAKQALRQTLIFIGKMVFEPVPSLSPVQPQHAAHMLAARLEYLNRHTVPRVCRNHLPRAKNRKGARPEGLKLQPHARSLVEQCRSPDAKIKLPRPIEIGRAACRERVCPYV